MMQDVFKEMIPDIVAQVAAASSTASGSGATDTRRKAAEDPNRGKLWFDTRPNKQSATGSGHFKKTVV